MKDIILFIEARPEIAILFLVMVGLLIYSGWLIKKYWKEFYWDED